jgi:hypothetical protein
MQQLADRHIDHVLGLIAVDNIVSIGNAVLGGLLLVGFARDETSLNYIAYHGRLRDWLSTDATLVSVGWKDHDRQQRLFAERKVVCDFRSPNKTGLSVSGALDDRQFAFLPIGQSM